MHRIAATLALVVALATLHTSAVDAKPRKHSAPQKQPDSPAVAKAKAQLKVARAVAKAAKAIEACEQAVVDACVESAKPDGSTDCEDEALKAEFAQCH